MKEISNKKIIVVGGAGFIGSNAVDELIRQGNKVVVIDNLLTGKEENIHKEAEFHKLDMTRLEDIKPLFVGADYVLHFAAQPSIPFSIKYPIESNHTNINGFLNVLVAARDGGVKRLIYSSSSSVYGYQDILPWREDMTVRPFSPYGIQKHVGELYARSFSMVFGLQTVSLRYFNAYGLRQRMTGAYASVIGIFLDQKKAGKPFTIMGNGEQKRDFTAVSDIVNANIAALVSQKVGKGEVINIGKGNSYSVNEVADMIGGEKVYLDPRLEVRESLADTSLAKELLDWETKVDLPGWLKNHMKEIGL